MVLSPGLPCLFFVNLLNCRLIDKCGGMLLVEVSDVLIIGYFLNHCGAVIRQDKLVFSPDVGRHPLDCDGVAAGCWRIANSLDARCFHQECQNFPQLCPVNLSCSWFGFGVLPFSPASRSSSIIPSCVKVYYPAF